jgi:outer membrane protein OmpA-like peptidoglycan-associated protein
VQRPDGRCWLLCLALIVLAPAASADEVAPPNPPPVPGKVVLRGIKFGSDTAYIEPASVGVLELVAQRLRENPEIRVRIEGYTDERGTEADNLELAQERAEAVKRILVGYGVGPERLDTVGLGEASPIAPNDTPEGRALNRRVELLVLNPEAAAEQGSLVE